MIEEVPIRIPSVLSRSRSKTFMEPPFALLLPRHTRPQFLTREAFGHVPRGDMRGFWRVNAVFIDGRPGA